MMVDMRIAVNFLTDFLGFDGIGELEGEVLLDDGSSEVAYLFELGEANTENVFD